MKILNILKTVLRVVTFFFNRKSQKNREDLDIIFKDQKAKK